MSPQLGHVSQYTALIVLSCQCNVVLLQLWLIFWLHDVDTELFVSAGMTKCLRAGGVGFGIALVYSVWTGRSRIMQLFGGGSS